MRPIPHHEVRSWLLSDESRIIRVPQDGDVGKVGYQLLEQFPPFPFRLLCGGGQSGNVAAGFCEARDEARRDRIADAHHDEGNRIRCFFDSEGGRGPGGHNDRHVLAEQLRDQGWKTLVVPFCPSIFDDDILFLDVAKVAQALAEWPQEIGLKSRRGVTEEPYAGDTYRLRKRRKRPRHARTE